MTFQQNEINDAGSPAFQRTAKDQLFTYVDLFAGCGGLSLGLRSSGGHELFAVEKAEGPARTFYRNLVHTDDIDFDSHTRLTVGQQAARGLVVAPVSGVLDSQECIALAQEVDLVAGGPPCQGFSLAGRRDKDDARNQLVWEFLDFVAAVNPRMVIIENVVGMGRKFDRADESTTFASVQKALESTGTGYRVHGILVNALHYGAPQHRPRLMVVGVRSDIATLFPPARESKLWASSFLLDGLEVPWYAPVPVVASEQRNLRDALDAIDPHVQPSSDYAAEMRDAASWGLSEPPHLPLNHELRRHRPQTVLRFQLAQVLTNIGVSARTLGPLADASFGREMDKLDRYYEANPNAVLRVGSDSFRNAAELRAAVIEARNKKHSQRVLKWGSPSHTVVTIPDDYVHPDIPRTFSVRELARIQGFPDSFEFLGKATTGGIDRRTSVPQYSQVGNAVSPLVGRALGRLAASILDARRHATRDTNDFDVRLT